MHLREEQNIEEMKEAIDNRDQEKALAGRVEEAVTKFSEDSPVLAEKLSLSIENGKYDEAEQALETLLLHAKALGNTMHGKLDEFRDIMARGQEKIAPEEERRPEKLAG